MNQKIKTIFNLVCWLTVALLISVKPAFSRDLQQVKEAGVLRHIGIPYANFVSYINKDGLYLHED